ncbi:hypothetical protein QBC34DRAFT_451759 [Podospora aff. communis PSN243]|uniref:Uncharacterized protein n=1 Tax=Podospora aff. communis PSN243 TaxID=3040156 RepID=A0AAV9GA64_9PEZI|nr:hypothetical protein QBC34DRAFT_451759 [Podospora aff. communis PSN243]
MVAIAHLLADRLPVVTMLTSPSWSEDMVHWFASLWQTVLEWASQPHIRAALLAWIITFAIIVIIILGLGFGPAGIFAGSLAAIFQSVMYGGFTPAGGVFALLTSVGMLGLLVPWVLVIAVVIATAVAGIVLWVGVGQ